MFFRRKKKISFSVSYRIYKAQNNSNTDRLLCDISRNFRDEQEACSYLEHLYKNVLSHLKESKEYINEHTMIAENYIYGHSFVIDTEEYKFIGRVIPIIDKKEYIPVYKFPIEMFVEEEIKIKK